MANVLYLVHRLPYPPNKGDKVRSYHLLKHLLARHRVFLGTFIDDAEDQVHIDKLRAMCAGLHVAALHPARARMRSLLGLLADEALTLGYYRDLDLLQWVRRTAQREDIDAVIVFSSSMVQYARGLELPVLIDFVDVDSAKWTAYADRHRWPLSWLYRREGAQLLGYERAAAARATRSFFCTASEADLFRRLAPECSTAVEPLCNGVDALYFAPDALRPAPFAAGEPTVVFTGAMDYWPNVDAVSWFSRDILPVLREQWPALRFYIVGRGPSATVRALASDAVVVTGTVADVRPYLQHASVVVAPMRLARGIQNKILEAMAMARPVVAASECGQALIAEPGSELLLADGATAFVREVDALLRDPQRAAAIGAAGRRRVVSDCSWDAQLSPIDRHLLPMHAAPAAATRLECAT